MFTGVGILSLAIGIGMCSVILSESNGLLRPTPGNRRIVDSADHAKSGVYPYFEQYRDRRDVVASAAAVLRLVPFAVVPTGDATSRAERVYGQIVSPEYFSTLGVSALPLPEAAPVQLKVEPDFRVLLFTLAIAVVAGIGFGILPALAITRTDPNPALKEGGRGALRRYRRLGLRNLFIAWQVAASLMLLLITGYVVLGYHHTAIDPGFSLAGLGLLSIDPVRGGYSADRAAALLANLPDELNDVTGVHESA